MSAGRRGDGGFVAGADGLIIGVLIIVAATLAFANLWAVLSARMAVQEAAGAGARAYVEASDADAASRAARSAVTEVLADHDRPVDSIAIDGERWARCARITVKVQTTVPRFGFPGLGAVGIFTINASHSELVDPYRSSGSLRHEANCAG